MPPERAEFYVRTNEKGLELVQRLASDAEFRERFEASPAEALAEYGIDLPSGRAESVADVTLPPQEELESVADEAGEPDELGYYELPLGDEWILGRILGAIAFVEGEY